MEQLDIRISHLKKSYRRPRENGKREGGMRQVLKDINLRIDNGSYIAVVGKSGSGKSTLLNILGLMEEYDAGEYAFNGKRIRSGRDYANLRLKNIGFIFQSYNLIPTLTCRENILLPTLYSGEKKGANLEELSEMLGIGDLLEQRVTTLSGGEKQRVAAARALILDPSLILADEPTGNLDPKNREVIFELFRREHEKGRAVIVITHDADTARQAECLYRLEDGSLKGMDA